MVQIIEQPRFKEIKFLPEIRDKPRLAVNDIGVGVTLMQQIRHSLGRLRCFSQLTVDEAVFLLCGEPCGSRKTLILLLTYEFMILQIMPESRHISANVG